jgi:predicted Zn-dependent protease with MMP-like domain
VRRSKSWSSKRSTRCPTSWPGSCTTSWCWSRTTPPDDPYLLGVYDGISLTERTHDHVGLPDRITIFRRPLLALCRDADELVHEVRVTVVHEIAHHFGINDARLHELGYG